MDADDLESDEESVTESYLLTANDQKLLAAATLLLKKLAVSAELHAA